LRIGVTIKYCNLWKFYIVFAVPQRWNIQVSYFSNIYCNIVIKVIVIINIIVAAVLSLIWKNWAFLLLLLREADIICKHNSTFILVGVFCIFNGNKKSIKFNYERIVLIKSIMNYWREKCFTIHNIWNGKRIYMYIYIAFTQLAFFLTDAFHYNITFIFIRMIQLL